MYRKIIIAFIPLLFLSSCGKWDCKVATVLKDVETFVNEKPDSALQVLNTIDRRRIVRPGVEARYALLKSIALDKSYNDVTEDSLTSVAVRWYKYHGTDGERMKAWYYDGRVHQNAGDNISAIISFTNAEEYARKVEDWFYLGMIYRGMSEIYANNYNHSEELEFAVKSKDCFVDYGDSKYVNYGLKDIARAYKNLRKFDKCIDQCETVRKIALETKDTLLQNSCLAILFDALIFKEDPEPQRAIELFSFMTDSLLYSPNIYDWNNLALTYSMLGEYVISSAILEDLKESAENNNALEACIAFTSYQVNKGKKNYEIALSEFEKAVFIQDSLFYNILNQSVVSTQKDYFKDQKEYEEYRVKVRSIILVLVILLSLVIIGFIVYALRKRIKHKDLEIGQYMSQISDFAERIKNNDDKITFLEETLESKNKEAISEFRTQIANLYRLKFSFLDDICRNYYSYGMTKAKQRQIFTTVETKIAELADDKDFDTLETIVNAFKDDVMKKLRSEFTHFKEKDFRMMCYLYAGFSNATVSLLMNETDMNTVYKRKSRLKARIEQSESPLKEFFISKLPK